MSEDKNKSQVEPLNDEELEEVKGGLSYTTIKTSSLDSSLVEGRYGKRYNTGDLGIREVGIRELGIRKQGIRK